MYRLKGKTVFITGATAGIGRATAEVFAREGAKLVLTARRENILKEVAEDLSEKYKVPIHIAVMDVSKREDVEHVFNSLPADFKEIDVLINNAGMARELNKLYEDNIDGWEEMIDTNIKGLLYVSRAIIPGMVERDRGHVINLGSTAGHDPYSGGSVYCGTKHAEKGITRALRMDLLKSNVRVTSIDPGLVETDFSKIRFYGDEERASKVYQGYTPLTPEDVAESILFAASRPSHMTVAEMILLPTDQASSTMVNKSL